MNNNESQYRFFNYDIETQELYYIFILSLNIIIKNPLMLYFCYLPVIYYRFVKIRQKKTDFH